MNQQLNTFIAYSFIYYFVILLFPLISGIPAFILIKHTVCKNNPIKRKVMLYFKEYLLIFSVQMIVLIISSALMTPMTKLLVEDGSIFQAFLSAILLFPLFLAAMPLSPDINLLFIAPAFVMSALLIFIFSYFFSLKKYIPEKKNKLLAALILTLFNAPYLYFFPVHILV